MDKNSAGSAMVGVGLVTAYAALSPQRRLS